MKTYTRGALATVALAALMAGAACSSSGGAGNGAGDVDSGAGTETNPDGVPYPSPAGGYGHTARSGSTPGSVLQNFKFQGYVDSNVASGLTTISMADYYDPCNKRYKMIHITVASVWCVGCDQETTAIVAAKSQLDSEQVVVLQALDESTVGKPATDTDLQNWIQAHGSNFTEMLDPGLQNFAGFFNAASVPWNADIDPRTMEIVDSSESWSGDLSAEINPGSVPATPSYPIPAAAQCP
jgi:hypothetical protein